MMTVLLVLLALAGAPLFAIIAASAMLGFSSEEVDLSVMGIEIYRLAEMPVLLAIPLFTFAGYLLGESDAPKRLVRLTNALLGWLSGGLAIVSLAACALFTAFTGASGVTIVALGALLYPALRQAKYTEEFSLGLVTTSGSLGLLFAPALPLILYGVVAQQMDLDEPVRIDDLFAAGLAPGLLMVVGLSVYSMWATRGGVEEERQPFSWGEAWGAIKEGAWEIPLPLVVLGGIYGGFFALSEAAAVTALYVLIVEVGIRREIGLRALPAVMRESMVLVGAIVVILGDLFIWASPNCGNPQKVQRYPREWAAALRKMSGLGAETLFPGHGPPILGADRVGQALGESAELLETLCEQTLAMMNEGATLDDVLHGVDVPEHLLERPYLRPVYDHPLFVVRNLWRLYGGWYDGNPAHLVPPKASKLGQAVAALAGGAAELAGAAEAAAADGDLDVACELVEMPFAIRLVAAFARAR